MLDRVSAQYRPGPDRAFARQLHPTFVSDALIADVYTTIAWLRHQADSALRTLGERLHAYVRHKRLHVYTHPFWTSPRPLWEMPDDVERSSRRPMWCWRKGMPLSARARRRALWTTPLADIVSYCPAPLVFVRTCKAEVIAGLSNTQVHELHRVTRMADEWRVGRHPVCAWTSLTSCLCEVTTTAPAGGASRGGHQRGLPGEGWTAHRLYTRSTDDQPVYLLLVLSKRAWEQSRA